jgi:XisH protein
MLEINEPDHLLYLAIHRETYQTFFQSRFVQLEIDHHQIELIIYDPIMEEIIQWIN